MLTTRVLPTSGTATIAGVDVCAEPARVKQLIGVVTQTNTLDRSLTVIENLVFHGRYFGMSAAASRHEAARLLEQFRLTDKADQAVASLSGGMAQRLMLARAVMHRPAVLFLDEPTAGLDPQSRIALWEVVQELHQAGQTVLLTTHYMAEADELCDRVAIMDHGRILALDTPAGLIRQRHETGGIGHPAADVDGGAGRLRGVVLARPHGAPQGIRHVSRPHDHATAAAVVRVHVCVPEDRPGHRRWVVGSRRTVFNDIIIGGVLASSIIFQGIQAVALPMVQDFGFTREIEDRVLAPLPVEALALQKVLAGAVQALLAALVIFPLALVVPAASIDLSIRPLYLCTLLPLGCVFSASLGLALGTRLQPKYVSLIFTLLLLPMTFLGCVYYPSQSLLALPVRKWAVGVNPLVYLAEGMRLSLSDRVPNMPALVIVVVMVVATAGLVKLGVDGFKRRVLT